MANTAHATPVIVSPADVLIQDNNTTIFRGLPSQVQNPLASVGGSLTLTFDIAPNTPADPPNGHQNLAFRYGFSSFRSGGAQGGTVYASVDVSGDAGSERVAYRFENNAESPGDVGDRSGGPEFDRSGNIIDGSNILRGPSAAANTETLSLRILRNTPTTFNLLISHSGRNGGPDYGTQDITIGAGGYNEGTDFNRIFFRLVDIHNSTTVTADITNITVTAVFVPEPATALLGLIGLPVLGMRRRRAA